VDEYLHRGRANGPVPHHKPFEELTARQREILQLIAEGHSTKEIAAKLELSVKTVDTHRTELMTRLGIHDIAGLVRYAIRVGLVSPEK
jgi:DNA-binding NarL/FixJ family response regulator